MPRYFFHLDEPSNRVWDEEGKHLPDLEAAKSVAIKAARAIMCQQVAEGRLSLTSQIHIVDEAGTCLSAVGFRKAVSVIGLSNGQDEPCS